MGERKERPRVKALFLSLSSPLSLSSNFFESVAPFEWDGRSRNRAHPDVALPTMPAEPPLRSADGKSKCKTTHSPARISGFVGPPWHLLHLHIARVGFPSND